MDRNVEFVEGKRLERVSLALRENQMQPFIAKDRREALEIIKGLVVPGARVACGGSMSLHECGVMDLLRGGGYDFLDRDAPGIDVGRLYRDSFSADWYLAGVNAVTENGEIYQVDGRGNRVAAIAYGPENVVLVAGKNKIVENLDGARRRRASIAAPANVKRLGCPTPCHETGVCSGCKSPGRICCTELVLSFQREANRIKVILVGEDLGY